MEGKVLLNGAPIPHGYRRLVAYVMQDDILPGTMSPRELFTFAANLRLPSYVPVLVLLPRHLSCTALTASTFLRWSCRLTQKERKAQVTALLDVLSLNDCANTRVRAHHPPIAESKCLSCCARP